MRIAYVLTSLGMGGAERQVLALASRMEARGHTVALLVLRPRLSEQWPTSLETVHLDMRRTPWSVLASLLRGRKFLKGFHPDLVHSHSFHANLAARLLKLFGSAPVVLSTVHNVVEGGPLRMLIYRLTDGLSRRTTAVSHAVAERFVRLKAVRQDKCVVVTNGIDIAEFALDADRRTGTRTGLAAGEAFVWLAAGRMVPAKDFPNLLRSFKLVRKAVPEAQLWIAGEATGAETKRIAEMFALERHPGEPSSLEGVRWLGLRRDMPALLDACDGFVLASAWEGMPLVVGEAMAMEKPVVATDVGGVRELVGDAGTVVPAADSDALAGAMLELMEKTSEDRRSLGRAARARIEANFSMDARADKWEALYMEVLEISR